MGIFINKDILLDDDAFESVKKCFEQLSKDIDKLKKDVESELSVLKTGFQTPGGQKFITSFENRLIKPMENQALIIKHVSENLDKAKKKYKTVFIEYKQLNKIL